MNDLLKQEEIETLFRVEMSLRNEREHWFYGSEIPSLLEQGLLVEESNGLQITPKGKALLLIARNGELANS
jgi:hypothetical protein